MEKAPPPDFTNVTESLTFTLSRLNTVPVVASGSVLADAVMCGKMATLMDSAAETCALIALESVATDATRCDVWPDSAELNVASADSSTGTVPTIMDDDKDAIALLRAPAALTTAAASEASVVSRDDTCVDQVTELADTFALRVSTATEMLVESAVSAACSNDAAVEIAEFSDCVCDPRADVAWLIAVLVTTSVD